jgi:hypothetical protein
MEEAVYVLFELTNDDPSTDGLGTIFREITGDFRDGDITVKELF